MPLVLGLLAGLVVSLMGWTLSSPLARTVTLFAQACGALPCGC
jgi:predicted permease